MEHIYTIRMNLIEEGICVNCLDVMIDSLYKIDYSRDTIFGVCEECFVDVQQMTKEYLENAWLPLLSNHVLNDISKIVIDYAYEEEVEIYAPALANPFKLWVIYNETKYPTPHFPGYWKGLYKN